MNKEEVERLFEIAKELKQTLDEIDRIQDLIAITEGVNSPLYAIITMNNTKAKTHLGNAYLSMQDMFDPIDLSQYIEQLSEKVHNAWWDEKKSQGFHAPMECPDWPTILKSRDKFKANCKYCHTDMYPYNELPENIKDYDRVTVRTVLNAIKELKENNTNADM